LGQQAYFSIDCLACYNQGPDCPTLSEALGPDWYLADEVCAVLQNISDTHLKKDIDVLSGEEAQNIVANQRGKISSIAVEEALSNDNAYKIALTLC
tara:strand:- start:3973 stop:4260 length:288 start_codon:yes stop_codon:yes gene_type:complete